MNSESFDLFLTLIKLKSYLISLVDQPEDCYRNFNLTDEFLSRRCPDKKEDIMNLLKENNINSDCDIAFDETIHEKFKDMVNNKNNTVDLPTLLNDLEIEANNLNVDENFKSERDERIKEILTTLFHIAQNWAARKELENDVDDYSTLEEEDVIRPEEEKKLDNLGTYNSISFNNISVLSKKYIEQLTEYYFQYGGDVTLGDFVNYMTNLKNDVSNKYSELFKKHGLDPDLIKE
ncbi:MAG: hypothetical protein NTX22_17585 [Ignavibacteriales bacterium]|nr:hypothetical protein [Ignavibacteriales bacterium]